jgi:GNAT superfamily N-acetyltransferase
MLARTHDRAAAAQLLASGCRLRRLAYDMVVDLDTTAIPSLQPATGVSVEALDCDPKVIAIAATAATPPDHVDFEVWSGVDRTRYWRQLLAGEGPCGAILPAASRLLRDENGVVVGAMAVAAMRASDWWPGDPWVPEIFVVPGFQELGLGGFLLGHAMRTCAAAGHSRLGLTVSDGNPARRLYERCGFRPFRSTWFIERGEAPGA